jgi:hypothetical protein
MREYSKPLKSIYQTGAEMLRLATVYNADVAHFDGYSIPAFYNHIKALPYKADPERIEYISRPAASLRTYGVKYRDCDDKAVCMGAALHRRKVPFRFVGVSTNPKNTRLHHVVVEALIDGTPRIIDATYPKNEIFLHGDYSNYEPLTGFTNYG